MRRRGSAVALGLLAAALLAGCGGEDRTESAEAARALAGGEPCDAPCWRTGVPFADAGAADDAGVAAQTLRLDVYRSDATPDSDAPVVVLMHGGGFVGGTRDQLANGATALAEAGYLAATIDYRLLPGDRADATGVVRVGELPRAVELASEDAVSALRFLQRNASALGAAPDEGDYAIGGYSAGAITALAVALRGGDADTPEARRFRPGLGIAIAGADCSAVPGIDGCERPYDRRDPPVLMFNGMADETVPFPLAETTCNGAREDGGGCTGFGYPGRGHLFSAAELLGGDLPQDQQPAVVPEVLQVLPEQLPAAADLG